MFDFIDKLRKKSRHQRHVIAFSTSAVFTGALLLLWFLSLGSKLGATEERAAVSYERQSPAKTVSNVFSSTVSAFKDQWSQNEKDEENISDLIVNDRHLESHEEMPVFPEGMTEAREAEADSNVYIDEADMNDGVDTNASSTEYIHTQEQATSTKIKSENNE